MKVIPRLQMTKRPDSIRFQCLKRFGQIHTKKATVKTVIYVWRDIQMFSDSSS